MGAVGALLTVGASFVGTTAAAFTRVDDDEGRGMGIGSGRGVANSRGAVGMIGDWIGTEGIGAAGAEGIGAVGTEGIGAVGTEGIGAAGAGACIGAVGTEGIGADASIGAGAGAWIGTDGTDGACAGVGACVVGSGELPSKPSNICILPIICASIIPPKINTSAINTYLNTTCSAIFTYIYIIQI
jgi:hypothetical protein